MATIDTSNAIFTETALKTLTVTQLKSMCKEKRLVGYSKLTKDNIVQKLLGSQPQAVASPVSVAATTQSTPMPIVNDCTDDSNRVRHDDCTKETTVRDAPTSSELEGPVQISRTARGDHTNPKLPTSSHSDSTLADIKNRSKSGSLKRSTATQGLPIPKKTKLDTTRQIINGGITSAPSTVASKRPQPMRVVPSDTPIKSCAVRDVANLTGKRRFKPLVPSSAGNSSTRTPMEPVLDLRKASSVTTLEHLDFPPEPSVPLTTILFPPSVAQRKHIASLSLILSAIGYDDLKTCALVSRAFRYAAYLSASHQLSKKFPGRRLQETLCRYSNKITDMWPYLKMREKEVTSRRIAYENSFLSKALNGIAEVSPRLWYSPDHEKQITIALRFLTTKFYFLISTGHGSNEYDTSAKPGMVLDAHEVVKNEIWKIAYSSSAGTQIFHVVEDTCEVIGESEYSSEVFTTPMHHGIRNDWQAYIDEASARKDTCPDAGLLDHLQWSNHEEYENGISKIWLKRVQGEGTVGVVKYKIARRYVFACVVENSISGPWRTANEMAQEFDGRGSVHTKKQAKKLNLFLPTHHHVESLHFTSASGKTLHEALAVVQTPGREYFILRDNGMQVGCEEEGVALIWMKALGCSRNGCVKH